MKKFLCFITAIVSLIAFSVNASAVEVKEIKTSGITVWLVEDHSIPLIAMNFSFEGGAATDLADKTGLTTFLTGMLDEGAGDINSAQFQKQISDNAIKLSFSASQHRITGSLQTLSKHREKAFSLLKLALSEPRFDPEPLERMRQQNLVNVKNQKEKSRKIASRAWLKTMLGDHPYARPKEGTVAGLKSITADDLRAKVKSAFTRDKLQIVVTGDIDAKTLKQTIADTFGQLPEKSAIGKVAMATINDGPKLQVIERDIPQSVIIFGHSGILRKDPDFIPAYVLFNIFGSGQFGSRLMEEIREKRGLAYSAYATLYPYRKAGLIFGATATQNARVGETVNIIKKEFKRMGREGPTQKELDNAIAYITGAYALRFDTNVKIASQLLGNMQMDLGIDYIDKRNDLVRAVTLKDIKRVAKRLFHEDKLVFTIVGKPQGIK